MKNNFIRKVLPVLIVSSIFVGGVTPAVSADEIDTSDPEDTELIEVEEETVESEETFSSEEIIVIEESLPTDETVIIEESSVPEASEATEESIIPEASEATEESIVPEVSEATEESIIPEVSEVTEESIIPEASEVTEESIVPEETEPSDIIEEEDSDVEAAGVALNSANFPDSAFRTFVKNKYDRDDNGYLSDSEISSVTNLSCSGQGISNLKGIKFFTSVSTLNCTNNNLTSLDVSDMKSLTRLYADNNRLTSINLSGTSNLKNLSCYKNNLATINISSCTSLVNDYGTCELRKWNLFPYEGYKYVYGGLEIDPTTVVKGAFGTPNNISLYSDTPNSIKISWGGVDGAAGYEIWRQEGLYSSKKTCIYDGNKTSITISKLNPVTTYYYYVRAYKKTASGQKICSGYTELYSCKTLPAAPKITAVTRKGATGAEFNITWDAVDGAEGYQVVRATSLNGTYNSFITTTRLTATDYQRTVGTMYYYKVRAYYKMNGVTYYGPYSSAKMIKVPTVPTGLKITSTARNSITLTWNKVAGANVNYEIWRSRSRNSGFVCIGRFDQNSKVSTKLASGTTYYYKVRAYYYCYDSQGQVHRIYGQYTSVVSGTTKK